MPLESLDSAIGGFHFPLMLLSDSKIGSVGKPPGPSMASEFRSPIHVEKWGNSE